MRARLAVVVFACASLSGCPGCPGPWFLALDAPFDPFAFGPAWAGTPEVDVRARFVRSTSNCQLSDPRESGYPGCENGGEGAPAVITRVNVDGAAFVLTNTTTDDAHFEARALGSTTLTVVASGPDGVDSSQPFTLKTASPDALVVHGLCSGTRAPSSLTAPLSSQMLFHVGVTGVDGAFMNVARLPAIDFGALTPRDGAFPTVTSPDALFVFPSSPASTTITSTDFPSFTLPARAYGSDEIEGITIVPDFDGPYTVQQTAKLDIAELVGGEVACVEDFASAPKTLTIDPASGSVCQVDAQPFNEAHVTDPPVVGVRGFEPGTCTVTATLDGTAFTATLSILFRQ